MRPSLKSTQVIVTGIESGKELVKEWTNSVGCNAVLEVSYYDCPAQLLFSSDPGRW